MHAVFYSSLLNLKLEFMLSVKLLLKRNNKILNFRCFFLNIDTYLFSAMLLGRTLKHILRVKLHSRPANSSSNSLKVFPISNF